ncbi:MAG TPA: hypothetical protein VH877_03575 [Polyangia bacterium]|nr:hypothetical protein [Polyangia bacterium]
MPPKTPTPPTRSTPSPRLPLMRQILRRLGQSLQDRRTPESGGDGAAADAGEAPDQTSFNCNNPQDPSN